MVECLVLIEGVARQVGMPMRSKVAGIDGAVDGERAFAFGKGGCSAMLKLKSPRYPCPGIVVANPAALNARQCAHALKQSLEKHRRHRARRLVAGARQTDAHCQDVIGNAAEICGAQPRVALEQKAGANQQNHGEPDLGSEQDLAQVGSSRARTVCPRAFVQREQQALVAGVERGDQSRKIARTAG